ncbi:DUF6090 family protein [Pseudotenacibaculum sp. MALMAid0570]|uniref:DUF6090 family protein n=1 Tax=Pseudotenacibaculum sp. MALMAid0570 TaxID=3143938 RepID=UPI0032DEE889
MIKLFRRTRQKLLSENKISKYLLYAIGEIILVVIGILIALQINNANENRKTRAIETSYLERLMVDLKENKTLWKETSDRKQKQLEAAHVFLNFRFSKNQDTVMKILPHFTALGSWEDININQVTFNEMVSSGTLNIITNDSIKIKLLSLDKLYKAILNRQELLQEEYRTLMHTPVMTILNTSNILPLDPIQRKIIKHGFSQEEVGQYAKKFQKEMITLVNDKSFMNGVVGITYNAPPQFKEFNQAQKEVTDLIQLINKELGND